jgi:hypothetical protein
MYSREEERNIRKEARYRYRILRKEELKKERKEEILTAIAEGVLCSISTLTLVLFARKLQMDGSEKYMKEAIVMSLMGFLGIGSLGTMINHIVQAAGYKKDIEHIDDMINEEVYIEEELESRTK